jgi:hypothetical protein
MKPTNMQLQRIAGEVVSAVASADAADLHDRVLAEALAQGIDPAKIPEDKILAVIAKATTQDRWWRSKRLWSAVLGTAGSALMAALVGALSDPGTQVAVAAWLHAHTGPYAPALVPLAAAFLAYLSKAEDPRPIREATK